MSHLGYQNVDVEMLATLVSRGRLDLSRSISDVVSLEDVRVGIEKLDPGGQPDPNLGEAVSPLTGRVALLTGASGGIGKGIAHALADEGVDLFLTYGRHGDDAEEVAVYARGEGRRVVVASADLTDPTAPARLVAQANDELGGVDILVANAGTADIKGWQNIDLESWNTTLAINLTAPFLLTQQVLPTMVEKRFGRVLFISSIAGLNGGVVGAHYAASKAGLHGLMHIWRHGWRPTASP